MSGKQSKRLGKKTEKRKRNMKVRNNIYLLSWSTANKAKHLEEHWQRNVHQVSNTEKRNQDLVLRIIQVLCKRKKKE